MAHYNVTRLGDERDIPEFEGCSLLSNGIVQITAHRTQSFEYSVCQYILDRAGWPHGAGVWLLLNPEATNHGMVFTIADDGSYHAGWPKASGQQRITHWPPK